MFFNNKKRIQREAMQAFPDYGNDKPKRSRPGWGDALGMVGGAMMDMDGTLGSGNMQGARTRTEHRLRLQDEDKQAELDKKRRQAILGGLDLDPQQRAMMELGGDDRNFLYNSQRDGATDARTEAATDLANTRYEQTWKRDETRYGDGIEHRDSEIARQQGNSDRTFEAQTVQGADGYKYYQNTEERVLPGVQKPQAGPSTADQRLTFDREKWKAEQAGLFAQPQQPEFNTSELYSASPFDELTPYGGARFMNASIGGNGQGGSLGGPDEELPESLRDIGYVGGPDREGGTVYDKKFDQVTASDLAEWQLNGQSTALSNLNALKSVIDELEGKVPNPKYGEPGQSEFEDKKNLTGYWVGQAMPGRTLFAPGSVDAEDRVGKVIQQSLKAILGGQFAQAEADALIRRSYNKSLGEDINANRLKTTYDELVQRAKINDAAARYSNAYGTMQGFQGYLQEIQSHGSTAAQPTSGPAPEGNIPSVSDDAGYAALPSGTEYIAPDGSRRRKK